MAKPTSIPIKVPSAGESITEADLVLWLKNDGDFVDVDEAIAELETDKASMSIPAPESGILKVLVPQGRTVKIGEFIATIEPGERKADKEATLPAEPQTEAKDSKTARDVSVGSPEDSAHYAEGVPSPAARKHMEEQQLQANEVKGTGKAGRITKQDALSGLANAPSPEEGASILVEAEPKAQAQGVRRVTMSRLRKTLAARLTEAQQEAALLTTFNEIDMGEVTALRKRYKESFQKTYGTGLSFMSFFIAAVTSALRRFPIINARLEGDEIVYSDAAHIGIAVATEKGLVVPVIRHTEHMQIRNIETEMGRLTKEAREGSLSLDDMSGGTFTITNGGVFGSMLSTPIINKPQSAILGMHNIVKRPIVKDDRIVVAPMMYVALTYDHRLIDGADSVRFLVAVKEQLEDPARLLLGL